MVSRSHGESHEGYGSKDQDGRRGDRDERCENTVFISKSSLGAAGREKAQADRTQQGGSGQKVRGEIRASSAASQVRSPGQKDEQTRRNSSYFRSHFARKSSRSTAAAWQGSCVDVSPAR